MRGLVPARVIWALGVTQVIGYGSLYYSFSVLAPAIGRSLGWPEAWVYGALTLALLSGGLVAPLAGTLADRFGAARVMTMGSIAAAVTLLAVAAAPNGLVFTVALVAMEAVSSLVLYATAFAALVQMGGQGAQRSITHLTLIAGFASTVFWPLTSLLLGWLDWRLTYVVFAALNLFCCAPLHLMLWRMRRAPHAERPSEPVSRRGVLAGAARRTGFALMFLGFAVEGFVLSGVLLQIVPLLGQLGLGAEGLLVSSLFGPAQVLSRLTNMVLGRGLPPTGLAVIAAVLLPAGLVLVAATAPALAGAMLFAVLFGLGSGLISIVSGALPLHLLGSENYGARLGWLSSGRQLAAAVAPFCLALMISALGPSAALWAMAALGLVAALIFGAIAILATRREPAATPSAEVV